MKKLILSICFSVILFFCSNAQTDCNNYLDRANAMYNEGRFKSAVSTINSCKANETDKVKQWQTARLLAKCYLGLDSLILAKSAAEDMLEKNPLYKPSLIEDSKEFMTLINKVKVVPRFSLSLSFAVGLNISYPNVMNSYGITDNQKTYSNGKANQIGLYAGYSYSDKLSLHAGALYVGNNYTLKYKVQDLDFKYSEKLNYLQVPLFVRYQVKPKGKFKVFAEGGIWTGFLTKGKYNMERKKLSVSENTELKNIDLRDNRTKNIFGFIVGAGASYKFREGHFFGDISYQYSFTNINKPDNRLSNENLIYNYYFIDDDLRLNNLTFSLGYTFYLNYFVQRSK